MHVTAITHRVLRRDRKGEEWMLEQAGDDLVATSAGGAVVTIPLAEAPKRITPPSFGGFVKHLELRDTTGETIKLHATGQVRRMARDFVTLAHISAGSAGPGAFAGAGAGMVVLSGLCGAITAGLVAWTITGPAAEAEHWQYKVSGMFAVVTIAVFAGGVRMLTKARRIRRLQASLDMARAAGVPTTPRSEIASEADTSPMSQQGQGQEQDQDQRAA